MSRFGKLFQPREPEDNVASDTQAMDINTQHSESPDIRPAENTSTQISDNTASRTSKKSRTQTKKNSSMQISDNPVIQTLESAATHKSESPGTQVSKTGRPPGKRSDPEYEQVTAYVRKDTYRRVKMMLLAGGGGEFSELVQSLLENWLEDVNGGTPTL